MTDTSPLPWPRPWTVRASRPVHRDRWIHVRADDCVTARGVEVSPYYVLEYGNWVQIVALDAEDHILLIRQYRHGLGRVALELPAGAMDPGESDPLAAAARELREETGYVAENLRLVGAVSPNPATHTNLSYTVLALGARRLHEPQPEPAEDIVVERVPYRTAVEAAVAGRIDSAIHVAALLVGLSAAGRLGFDYAAEQPRG
ncbi:MAG TPA: NUDIX hydrolase [Microvirga sp.]|jgi:8-oxo-dGTP pyrophosphatase MutT (NUDIX family)|nr:NUDIX hydrolase [Microvirga sp.]